MYREYLPSPRLRPWVECLWTSQSAQAVSKGRVFPDGCVDILYLRGKGRARLDIVGAMTRVHTVATPADLLAVGVRFHPGGARAFLGLPLGEATDGTIPLEDVWNARGGRLLARLSDCASIPDLLRIVESALEPPENITPARQALLALPRNRELWTPEELARQAGFSPRHLRRFCLDETGLTPKRLCRVLRFRRALTRIRARQRNGATTALADLAAEAGYYDQSHLIREFRELGGCAPGALLSKSERAREQAVAGNSSVRKS